MGALSPDHENVRLSANDYQAYYPDAGANEADEAWKSKGKRKDKRKRKVKHGR